MKNMAKFIGIITFAAVIGFSAVSCKDDVDDTSEKSVTITGLPSTITGETAVGLYPTPSSGQPPVGGMEIVAGDSFTFALWDNDNGGRWTGTGDYYVFLTVTPIGSNDFYMTKTSQKFSKANTTVAFSEFGRL
jgi:hypothetical protein